MGRYILEFFLEIAGGARAGKRDEMVLKKASRAAIIEGNIKENGRPGRLKRPII